MIYIFLNTVKLYNTYIIYKPIIVDIRISVLHLITSLNISLITYSGSYLEVEPIAPQASTPLKICFEHNLSIESY